MDLSLRGQEVSRICFDYAVVIEATNGTEVRIGTPFQLWAAELGHRDEVRPERVAEMGSTVVSLLRQKVVEASVGESGGLRLRFASGQRLECPPDERFEAWTLVTASGERMVCMPGGGIARWPGTSTA
jgi:hypothetical protein